MSRYTRRKKYRFKPRFFVIIGVLAMIVVLFGACHLGGGGDDSSGSSDSGKKAKTEEEKVVTVNVTCAGDIIGHSPLVEACRTDDGYDFTPCFRYIKDIITEADASICTFEGSMTEPPYSGYPLFRSPKDLATSVKKVGFTTIDIASNHSADNGKEGFDSTIKTCKDAGLIIAGEQENEGDPKYAMVKTDKGVNVAFVHYTYNDGSVEQPTVNGIPLDESQFSHMREVIDAVLADTTLKAGRDAARAQAWEHRGESVTRTVDYLVNKYEELTRAQDGDER